MKAQIRQMYQRDGLSVNDIAQVLGVDESLVAFELEQLGSTADVSQEKETAEASPTEKLALRRIARADEVMGELLEVVDSDILRFKAAAYILDAGAGLKRPPRRDKEAGVPMQQINILIQQAAAAYDEQKRIAASTIVLPLNP